MTDTEHSTTSSSNEEESLYGCMHKDQEIITHEVKESFLMSWSFSAESQI